MIFVTYETEKSRERKSTTFNSWDEYDNFLFSPFYKPISVIDFRVKGKTYAERKAYAREMAIEYQTTAAPGLTWGELSEIGEKLREIGRRVGLLREFKENVVC